MNPVRDEKYPSPITKKMMVIAFVRMRSVSPPELIGDDEDGAVPLVLLASRESITVPCVT